MSPLMIAQIFYLLASTNAAPPDLVADVERVEVIAGAKDILLPCRSNVHPSLWWSKIIFQLNIFLT